ncbi:MAG TPA: hypothetical protein VEC19_10960 [Usitatibacter sp.]|nr:hypothetical protein [Usitatibacter sp.]
MPGRLRDAASILPVAGLVLLMPPVITLFAAAGAGVAGVPLIVIYVFGTWMGLIASAALLARRLR